MENYLPQPTQNSVVAIQNDFQQQPRITFEQIPQYMVMLNAKLDSILSWITQFNTTKTVSTDNTQDNHILMNFDDACKFVCKGHSTIYALTSNNKIPFHKRGNKLYFFKDELLKWIETGGAYEVAPAIEEKEEQDFEAHLAAMRKGMKHKAERVEK